MGARLLVGVVGLGGQADRFAGDFLCREVLLVPCEKCCPYASPGDLAVEVVVDRVLCDQVDDLGRFVVAIEQN